MPEVQLVATGTRGLASNGTVKDFRLSSSRKVSESEVISVRAGKPDRAEGRHEAVTFGGFRISRALFSATRSV